MQRHIAVLGLVLAACGSGGGRTVTGTLAAQHPLDTSILAISSNHRVKTPVATDGRFSVKLPPGGVYRLHFVAQRAGHNSILGTVKGANGKALLVNTQRGTTLQLGTVGRSDQRLEVGMTQDECLDEGADLNVESEEGGGGPDAGEPGGDNNELDGGGANDSQKDNVCEDGEHGIDGGTVDGGKVDGGR